VTPYRVKEAEEALMGKKIDEAVAEAVGEVAVSRAKPMTRNTYMVQIAKTLVKRTILACA
jgi:CO/xanthine dehydrogenase FAD-binding subunit